jgi:hypothetical protein
MPKVSIVRPSTVFNQGRTYKVIINNKQVAKISNGETLDFELEPGENQILLKLDWTSSQKYTLNLSADSNEKLTVEVSKSSFILTMIAAILFLTNFIFKSNFENKMFSLLLTIPALLIVIYSLTIGRNKHLILSNLEDNM